MRILGLARSVLVAVAMFAFACGDDGAPADAGMSADAGPCGPGEVEGPGGNCFMRIVCPDTIPTFKIGLESRNRDDLYTGVIVDASPSPPMQFLNDWVIDFVDADGAPVDGITLDFAESFMPAHNHDGLRDPEWAEEGEPGRFAVDGINMWMPGPWEVRFDVTGPDGSDRIVFDVCI